MLWVPMYKTFIFTLVCVFWMCCSYCNDSVMTPKWPAINMKEITFCWTELVVSMWVKTTNTTNPTTSGLHPRWKISLGSNCSKLMSTVILRWWVTRWHGLILSQRILFLQAQKKTAEFGQIFFPSDFNMPIPKCFLFRSEPNYITASGKINTAQSIK